VWAGIRIAVDLDEEVFGSSGDELRDELERITRAATA
jgi:hypothetical protein